MQLQRVIQQPEVAVGVGIAGMGPAVRCDLEKSGFRRLGIEARSGDQVESPVPPDVLYLSYVRAKSLIDDRSTELPVRELAVYRNERRDQIRAGAELIARTEAIRGAVDLIAIRREEKWIET